jgi:hypothetical protein
MKPKIRISEKFLTRSLISNPDQESIRETKISSLQDIKNRRKWIMGENGYLNRVKETDEGGDKQTGEAGH